MNAEKTPRSVSSQILPPYRNPGMSPGDYIDVIRAEVDRLLLQTHGNRLKALSLGFKRMVESGLITDRDLKRLEKVSIVIMSVEQGKYSSHEAVAKLDKLYLEALADPGASSMGATMIGVTYSARTNQNASAAGLMGMVIGGLLTGGPGGALIGGLVGWTVGGGCKEDK
jgi:hypothetical protein